MEVRLEDGVLDFFLQLTSPVLAKPARPRFCDAIASKASNQLQVVHGPQFDRLHMAGFVWASFLFPLTYSTSVMSQLHT